MHVRQEGPVNKKHVVRLTDEQRAICEATIEKEKGFDRWTLRLLADRMVALGIVQRITLVGDNLNTHTKEAF
jgi:hypothetical protein